MLSLLCLCRGVCPLSECPSLEISLYSIIINFPVCDAVETSVDTTSMATAEGGPEAATTPDPVTPGDVRSSSGGATFTLTSSERGEKELAS